jgi:hypothetical protein
MGLRRRQEERSECGDSKFQIETAGGHWLRFHVEATTLDLTDEQTETLIRELSQIVQNDRYPLSPSIVALKEILGQLRLEPVREPLPPRRYYEPPNKGRYKRCSASYVRLSSSTLPPMNCDCTRL